MAQRFLHEVDHQGQKLLFVQPEAEIWFARYQEMIPWIVASFGPASTTAVLRQAFFKRWKNEQRWHQTLQLPSDACLYALGRRGALAALHGFALPDFHQSLAMIHLALGALNADERFENMSIELDLNCLPLTQEVISICMTYFGLSEPEARQCVKAYNSDAVKRWKS